MATTPLFALKGQLLPGVRQCNSSTVNLADEQSLWARSALTAL
jgi:hypothetical protein